MTKLHAIMLAGTALVTVGCAAVYPEVAAPVRSAPKGRSLEPPPPSDLVFLRFARAEIPERTRDGRKWGASGGATPNSFARVFVDGKEIFHTPIESGTLAPTWPDQVSANYRIAASSRIRVELWDEHAINNHPICVKEVPGFSEQIGLTPIEIRCESEAKLWLRAEPAHARWGLGFSYELRTGGAAVTRVLAESPAARSGLTVGDDIVAVGGTKVSEMGEGVLQSKINSDGQIGVELSLESAKGPARKITVKEGPIYPVSNEDVAVE